MKQHSQQPASLLTASAVARLCAVDLKTIHNWSNDGEIRHFRTPGRHLRFRVGDVIEFLSKYGYAVPEELFAGRERLYVLDDEATKPAALKRSLSGFFEVTTFDDPIDALIGIGAHPPAVIVLDVKSRAFDGLHFLARLAQLPATRKIPKVVFSAAENLRAKALDTGAFAFIVKPDVEKLKETLETLP
jgi:excisionase family DNA binding protein